uniref:C-type lectin domain-containing protein n=1 Tax=Xiphophorus couchianus TaxID=32473 RepID=A0A3B5M6L5_9TELE
MVTQQSNRAGYTLGQKGAVPPQTNVLPPQMKLATINGTSLLSEVLLRTRRSSPVCLRSACRQICAFLELQFRLQYEGNIKLIRRFNISTGQYLQKGWLYFRDSFYYISSTKKTWDESRKYCLREDADLLIINSREEQNFITQLSRDKLTWIGLRELSGTERWIWVDGAPLTERFLLFLNIKKNKKLPRNIH